MQALYYSYKKRTERPGFFNMVTTSRYSRERRCREQGLPVRLDRRIEILIPQVWEGFPEELFESIIARLPMDAISRFRVICKTWNALPASPGFSELHAQVQKPQVWIYMVTQGSLNDGAMYNPSSKEWHRITVSALPRDFSVWPLASTGGLICFLHRAQNGVRSFYVGNPLTQTFKMIPSGGIEVWGPAAIAMAPNGCTPWSYNILSVNCDGEFEIFDSIKNDWTVSGTIPTTLDLPLCLNFQTPAIFIGSTFYFLLRLPEGIVSYDMATGVWNHLRIPGPVHSCDNCSVAKCGNRILLVGVVREVGGKAVCVWELEKMTLLWKEIARMPDWRCWDFDGKLLTMSCLGNEDVLLLSFKVSRLAHSLVTYDVLSGEWFKVVDAWLTPEWVSYGTCFRPSFSASPH